MREKRPATVDTIPDKLQDLEARIEAIEITLKIKREEDYSIDTRYKKYPTTTDKV